MVKSMAILARGTPAGLESPSIVKEKILGNSGTPYDVDLTGTIIQGKKEVKAFVIVTTTPISLKIIDAFAFGPADKTGYTPILVYPLGGNITAPSSVLGGESPEALARKYGIILAENGSNWRELLEFKADIGPRK